MTSIYSGSIMVDITTTAIDELITSSAPVVSKERIKSIDTLRGVALFGILLLNIIAFAFPLAAYFDPRVDGATEGINLLTYMSIDIFVEGSMRTIFSMLFGAGMLLFLAKPDIDVAVVRKLFYRRTTLLIGFGLVNAYLFVWIGDILYGYGVAGLILYFFRDQSATRLATYGAIILACLAILHTSFHYSTKELRTEVIAIEALPATLERTPEQEETMAQWDQFLRDQFASPEQIEEDLMLRKSGYLAIVAGLAPINFIIQTVGTLFNALWDVLSMMLLGMAFMKWGLFDASRSMRFYSVMMLGGFAAGLTVNTLEVLTYVESGFEIYWSAGNRPTYDLGRMLVALGYIGLVMMICKAGVLSWLRSALAAVGQMALTNYLSQSIICNVIFMGFGFGLIGELQRYQIYYVVFGIWVFQLITSVIWLRYYKFGPAEWLWRSLTYKKRQPIRLQALTVN